MVKLYIAPSWIRLRAL